METILIIHLEDEPDLVRAFPRGLLRKIEARCRSKPKIISVETKDKLESKKPGFSATFLYGGQSIKLKYKLIKKAEFEECLSEHKKSHRIVFALLDWRHNEEEVSFGIYNEYATVLNSFDWVFLTGWPELVSAALPDLKKDLRVHSKLADVGKIVDRMLSAIFQALDESAVGN